MRYIIIGFCWLATFFTLLNFLCVWMWFVVALCDRSMNDTSATYMAEGVLVGGMWAAFLVACKLGRYVAENYTICRRDQIGAKS